ncbi:DUF748 domain-containing protein [Azonexus sp. IMCC34839]|uniref:DUF748 domain-containing protein n=1 Tax=Azonexus sp. IMCC34839 TaxID=3133695 RepID=UPI00399A45E2
MASRLNDVLKSSKTHRFAKWLGGFLLAFGLFGYFAAPPILKSVLLSVASEQLNRDVSVERIDVNPYALSVRINGLSIRDKAGKEAAGFDELYVNLSSASVFKFAAVIDEIRLQGLRLAVAHLGDGRYDISDLLDKWMQPKEEEPDSATPRFSLNNIQLVDARIEFDDRPKGKLHKISEINLALPFVSSLPYQAEVLVQPAFSANIDGSTLALKGRSKPFAQTHESELDLDLDRFDLAGVQAYLPDSLPFRIASGTVDSELKANFKEVTDGTFSLAVVGALHVSGLVVNESNGAHLLGWKRLDVDIDKADPLNRRFEIKRVALEAPEFSLGIDRQGELNVLRVLDRLSKAPTAKEAPAKTDAGPALQWSLGEFALDHGGLRWRDESRSSTVAGEVRQLHVAVGEVDGSLSKPIVVNTVSFQIDMGERLKVEKMAFKDIRVDLPARRVELGELLNQGTQVRMLRNKAGEIEWLNPPALKTAPKAEAKPAAKDDKPWVAKLDKLAVDALAFRFEDQTTQPAAVQQLDGFSVQGQGLTNEVGKKGQIAIKGKVNAKGSLDVSGSLQASPLDIGLRVETVAIPMMPLEPYFGQFLNISVTRGQVSNKGEASLQIADGKLKAAYKGSATLGDFVAVDKLNSADFLKWKSLYFGNVDFRLDPLAINIGEIALADFYSRLILNKDGRLNVADIVKKPETNETVAAGDTKPAAGNNQTAAEPAKAPPPIKIAKITVQNGTVNFSDFFVKPNYTVNVTKLAGKVNGLSSAADTVADLEMRGSYANSAPVLIAGKLNPLAAKSFLDIKTDITGVDLVGFSPYSGKYAGYAIEKGKLSMNLAYKLENRQLTADNRVFIDQFTFGDKVESPDATKLPVNLALSLLKNNRGEIDINLPISGSLDDPEFSVGGLIVRVIVNLFVKAVTSPFALLGSMFGGGEELSNVDFAVGRASLSDAATKKLEALAKALTERQSLKLEITGRADPELDKEGVKRVAIERAMKTEKLKDLRKSGEGNSLEAIEIAPEEYKTYLTRAYREAKFPKPRNAIGMLKDLPVEEMEKLMLANLPASDEDLRQLARQRAENVQAWLVDNGKVPPERVFLLPEKAEADEKAKGNRVDFSLR